MCGVVGLVSAQPVNQALYNALTVMQHRGQDAAGIVTTVLHYGQRVVESLVNGLSAYYSDNTTHISISP